MTPVERTALREFSIEYHHNGSRWSAYIMAEDWADAERRLMQIKAFGKVSGETIARIPVPNRIARLFGCGT